MFRMLQKLGKNKYCKQLDEVIQRIEMNMSNNYKDAAQENLKELEKLLEQVYEDAKITKTHYLYYEDKISAFHEQMKNFTHKDQKPFWA